MSHFTTTNFDKIGNISELDLIYYMKGCSYSNRDLGSSFSLSLSLSFYFYFILIFFIILL